MALRLVDRLRAARQRQFVGRSAECELFRGALAARELPFSVLHIFGPGGIGKTTLLAEFSRICQEAEVPACLLDAREIDPSPEPFLAALRQAMGLLADAPPRAALSLDGQRQVLLIDTYEALAPLDGWLRDVFLPQLPADALIVLAGRDPPATAWRSDPGWQDLVRLLPLRNLTPDESLLFLRQRDLPAEAHRPVLEFTHGHPLALSLVADTFAQRENVTFQPEDAPDIVRTLLSRFVQKVPGPAHRAALEACALVRLMTEPLLQAMLPFPDVSELFDWLRDLSFIESSRQGLFPHELAREALTTDLRWRNPDWYATLHARARAHYAARLQQAARQIEQQRILLDYIFLHRDNPAVRPFYVWNVAGGLADIARPGDWPAVRAMIAAHEGEQAALIVEHWLQLQPQSLIVFRDESQAPQGFLLQLALHLTDDEQRAPDPCARAAWEHLQRHAPLRGGEEATLFRSWMARDAYQGVSATQSLIFVQAVQHYLTTPGLAFSMFVCADGAFWAPLFAYADMPQLETAAFEVGGRPFAIFGHDWRATPPGAWLARLAARETAEGEAPGAPQPALQIAVLSQDEFFDAVRAALRDLTRPAALASNPLLRSRLLGERVGPQASNAERAAALQELLRTTCEALQASPRDAKLYRVLYHSFIIPSATQEQAAELLDLPFSTYRRYLKSAVQLVSEHLWQGELQHPG
jgi:hypothetical protein